MKEKDYIRSNWQSRAASAKGAAGDRLTPDELEKARVRLKDAVRLQEIEGNPLTADEIAMFEMFEREAWPHERCIEYIRAKAADLGLQ